MKFAEVSLLQQKVNATTFFAQKSMFLKNDEWSMKKCSDFSKTLAYDSLTLYYYLARKYIGLMVSTTCKNIFNVKN